jgi:hypothetical protein
MIAVNKSQRCPWSCFRAMHQKSPWSLGGAGGLRSPVGAGEGLSSEAEAFELRLASVVDAERARFSHTIGERHQKSWQLGVGVDDLERVPIVKHAAKWFGGNVAFDPKSL